MQDVCSTESPNLAAVLMDLGRAGQRLTEMQASEGASGNLSVYLRDVKDHAGFDGEEPIVLPEPVPELAGGSLVVTGSGTRSREIREAPYACLGCVEIAPDGLSGILRFGAERRFARLTSELNSHLVVHREQVARHGLAFHAVVHAQPRKVTYLSHLVEYEDERTMNRRLLRWQPEAILNFPEGVGVVPFRLPGQRELMLANERALRDHRIAVWCKHGVMARSSTSVLVAVDLIEYLETAAAYECLDYAMGRAAVGLTNEQIRQIAGAYGVTQDLF